MVANRDSLIPQCRCKPQRAYRRHLADGIVLLMLSCALPGAMADTVDIAAVVGFTDTFRPGRWTPLNVTVTNHGGGLNGELEVQTTGSDEWPEGSEHEPGQASPASNFIGLRHARRF
jgi:hypothetical protein